MECSEKGLAVNGREEKTRCRRSLPCSVAADDHPGSLNGQETQRALLMQEAAEGTSWGSQPTSRLLLWAISAPNRTSRARYCRQDCHRY